MRLTESLIRRRDLARSLADRATPISRRAQLDFLTNRILVQVLYRVGGRKYGVVIPVSQDFFDQEGRDKVLDLVEKLGREQVYNCLVLNYHILGPTRGLA